MADGDHGSTTCRVKIPLAIRGVDETALAPNSLGIGLEKVSGKNSIVHHKGRRVTANRVAGPQLDIARALKVE